MTQPPTRLVSSADYKRAVETYWSENPVTVYTVHEAERKRKGGPSNPRLQAPDTPTDPDSEAAEEEDQDWDWEEEDLESEPKEEDEAT